MAVRKPREKEKIKDYALKHSAAHLMASAILELHPHAHLAIGPPTEDGFYYDVGNAAITQEALPKIEAKMKEMAKKHLKFEEQEYSVAEAKKLLKHQPFKLEILGGITGKITFYKHGNFLDLCEGPHVKDTSELKYVKLMKVAGAYWRGDEHEAMLTRVYGVVFKTREELDRYLTMLEEAAHRDHKRLGKELDLFTFSPLVGQGLPLWTPKGTRIREKLDSFIWELRRERGYQKVTIPHLAKKELYETSGHWKKFQDDLFKVTTREGHLFVVKPMNCPHHTQIFASKPRRYREMPQRYCETTMMYRDEQSGELSGLTRVRSISIDDAHVFCRKDQVEQEIMAIWDIIDHFYAAFGFSLAVRFSCHDPDQFEKYLGTTEEWKTAEEQMAIVVKKRKVAYEKGVGEAAFYGPKIDFITKDSLGREWQVATIQLDFNQPARFHLTFTNEQGKEEQVVMIHAAIAGSFERFIGVLIEHLAGKFPVWLSPVQVALLTVTDRNVSFARGIKELLEKEGMQVDLDDRSETIAKKVREAQIQKIPYAITIGDKEVEKKTLAIRTRDGKVEFGVGVEEFIQRLKREVEGKERTP